MTRYVGQQSLGSSIVGQDEFGNPALIGSRCPVCHDVRFPARALCVNDQQVCEPHAMRGTGRVYEVVRMALAPEGFTAPYLAGYIDLDAGVRIFAQVEWPESGPDPAHGDRVEMTVGPVGEQASETVYGPVFRKLAADARE